MKRYTPAIQITKIETGEEELTTHAEAHMIETHDGDWVAVEDIPIIIKWLLNIWG